MIKAAITYAKAGIPVFPCRPDTKRPFTENGFKAASANEQQVGAWWRRWPDAWIGVPGGEVNFFDIDAKHQPGLVEEIEKRAEETGLDWILSLPKQATVNGGAHLLFRCPGAEVRNKTFARNADKDTIIETRGAGGYGIVAPSPGYTFARGSLFNVPTITSDQLNDLLDLARSFDCQPAVEVASTTYSSGPSDDAAPGHDYNQRGDVFDLLRKHGWHAISKTRWRRPGKEQGVSATWSDEHNMLYVFSSNAHPLEPERAYDPFGLYAALECGGDLSEAARRLREEGYGGEAEPDPAAKSIADAVLATHERKQEARIDDGGDESDPWALITRGNLADTGTLERRKRAQIESVFVLDKMAIQGQSTVFYMAYGGGKTLLTFYQICEAIKAGRIKGENVLYLNADDTFEGANVKAGLANEHGFNMVVPDNEGALSCEEIVMMLSRFAVNNQARRRIIILDTLKKFADLMDKKTLRVFGKNIRSFVESGGTIIALAHVNKYKCADGKSIHEGTGDILSDFDCAYVADMDTPRDEANRQVTFRNQKQRGPVAQKMSFTYDAGEGLSWQERFNSVRRVSDDAAAEMVENLLASETFKQDRPVIEYLQHRLRQARVLSRRALAQECFGEGLPSRGQREKVLDRYDQSNPRQEHRLWFTRTNATGGKSYELSR